MTSKIPPNTDSPDTIGATRMQAVTINPMFLYLAIGLAIGAVAVWLLKSGDKVTVANPGEIPNAVQAVRKTVADVEAKADLQTLAGDFKADADALDKIGFKFQHPIAVAPAVKTS